jgi:hypothetical protein
MGLAFQDGSPMRMAVLDRSDGAGEFKQKYAEAILHIA